MTNFQWQQKKLRLLSSQLLHWLTVVVLQLALETLPQKVAPTRLSHQVDDKSFPTEQSLAKTRVAGNLGMPIIGANKTCVKHFLSSRKLLVSHTSYWKTFGSMAAKRRLIWHAFFEKKPKRQRSREKGNVFIAFRSCFSTARNWLGIIQVV